VIDIFLLHEQESEMTIRGHREALELLIDFRQRGLVRAVGLSTHTVAGVLAALNTPGIDVVHPLLNLRGIGIIGASREEMERAVLLAKRAGLGVYGMKPLGGGNLLGIAREALQYAFSFPGFDAVAVGMKSVAEVRANAALAEGRFEPEWWQAAAGGERRLHIESWCQGCGRCVEACPQSALFQEGAGRPVRLVPERCVLCGYCGAACELFGRKII
jgi:aryl-alcohol dehydrogenase-like predicted oxidoreductase